MVGQESECPLTNLLYRFVWEHLFCYTDRCADCTGTYGPTITWRIQDLFASIYYLHHTLCYNFVGLKKIMMVLLKID